MTTITATPPDYADDVRQTLRETPATDSHRRLARFVAALAPADVPDAQLGAHLAAWVGAPSRAEELAAALQGGLEPSAATLRRAAAALRAGAPGEAVATETALPAETVGQLATWLAVVDGTLTL